jgi:mono/diheme cytochrome c family protein
MRIVKPSIVAGFTLAILGSGFVRGVGTNAGAQPTVAPSVPVPTEADEMAWELFAQINRPANNYSQDSVWETWADDAYQFPASPNPRRPPTWPEPMQVKALRNESPTLALALRGLPGLSADEIHAMISATDPNEEVRRNQPMFDYIVANNLWYNEGIAAFAKAGRDAQAPLDAIMVKARWKIISEIEKPRYHWNYAIDPTDNQMKVYGLTALHLTSKKFPSWLWATFEQVDNPDRGRVLGFHDSFGVTPADSNGPPSWALRELFVEYGLGAEWLNYRLDGTQIDFTDGTGQGTVLGNTQIEGEFGDQAMAIASCIACHARVGASIATGVQTGDSVFATGTPPAALFYAPNGKKQNVQLDFTWGLATAHNAVPASAAPPTLKDELSPSIIFR